MRKPSRLYNAQHMAKGVQLVGRLQQLVLQKKPDAAGPLAALTPAPAPAGAEPAELLEAHCHGCQGKKTFQVEGEETMPNGAIRKHGTAVCGHKVSTFVSGAKGAV